MKEFHAVANLFPLLEGAAFEELTADIKKNGLREPILVDANGCILDGRNRYRACLKAGVEPRFEEWKGDQPLPELALSLNLHRRHLDESQRAVVAARLAMLLMRRRFGERVANLPPSVPGKSRDKAAAQVNVSPRLVTAALQVLREGGEQVIAEVESGRLTVSRAAAKLAPRRETRVATGKFGDVGSLENVVLLWISAAHKQEAMEALKERGFQFTG
jgi:ParB-like chromosome segregation protein Spo0J